MTFGSDKQQSISAEQALPGRTQQMKVPEKHHVLGTPLRINTDKTRMAVFGMGCFWGVERKFWETKGVITTAAGYSAGYTENPTYEDVCRTNSGHAEVVEIDFDPNVVSYEKLLSVFWELHDPTTLNRQGPDVGTQYRSAVFYHNDNQKEIAELSKANEQKSGNHKSDIVTEVTLTSTFYKAEDYHQQYLEKRGLSSCKIK